MEIPAKLRDYRYHLIVGIVSSVVLGSLAYAAPRFLNIVAYFWPLLASTAAILAMVVGFGGVHQISGEEKADKTGEGLLDYVAGSPQYQGDSHNYE